MYGNSIDDVGSAGEQYQQQGLQIGTYSACDVYGNVITNGPVMGIIVLGAGASRFFNNLVVGVAPQIAAGGRCRRAARRSPVGVAPPPEATYLGAPGARMATTDFGYEKTLGSVGFDDAIQKVTEALKVEGFGILTEIDVQATLKKKIDVDVTPYKILGACNPKLAHRAISSDPGIGLLLPCNVVVRATDAGVSVSIASPKAMFKFVDDPDLVPVAEEADERIRRVVDGL